MQITQAALACASKAIPLPPTPCLEANANRSVSLHTFFTDFESPLNAAAHCDDADQSHIPLINCATWVRERRNDIVNEVAPLGAQDLESLTYGVCEFTLDPVVSPAVVAKCAALADFGRLLHTVQDFYSHSNWADHGTNPIGLARTDLFPWFALGSTFTEPIDTQGTVVTGCFSLLPDGCSGRIKHSKLNKDWGNIDLFGHGSLYANAAAVTDREGQDWGNFPLAVTAAIEETQRQWSDLQSAIRGAYPAAQADRIICALSHDRPVDACSSAPPPTPVVGGSPGYTVTELQPLGVSASAASRGLSISADGTVVGLATDTAGDATLRPMFWRVRGRASAPTGTGATQMPGIRPSSPTRLTDDGASVVPDVYCEPVCAGESLVSIAGESLLSIADAGGVERVVGSVYTEHLSRAVRSGQQSCGHAGGSRG